MSSLPSHPKPRSLELWIGVFLIPILLTSSVAEEGSYLEFFSPRLRSISQELDLLQKESAMTFPPVLTNAGERLGFHSRTFFEPDEPDSLVVDLGRAYVIDLVALVPVMVETPLFAEGAYGFPRRFEICLSLDRSFGDSDALIRIDQEDFPNPGAYPVTFDAEQKTARYVRVTSLLHSPNLEHFIWALGELLVISENRNVAAGATVTISRAPTFPPAWMASNLTDAESIASIPMVADTSPSNGWLADQNRASTEKWVAVTWTESVPIDEVRLIPARPTDMADTPGMGFPRKYRVESQESEKGPWLVLYDSPLAPEIRTSENMVVITGIDQELSAVRVVAEILPTSGSRSHFALAEMQVYSGSTNVALGGTVSASDSFADPRFPRWAPEYLVDGYTSQFRLVEWKEYLSKLGTQSRNTRRASELRAEYSSLAAVVQTRVSQTAWILGIMALGSGVFAFIWVKRQQVVAAANLREQISRDLHDDIGSSLGGIALISEACMQRNELPGEATQDLQEIHEVARASSESMRDIVWLVREQHATVHDLTQRMKEAAVRLSGTLVVDWKENLDMGEQMPVSLLSRRHILLSFKEAIYNAVRHSGGSKIFVEVRCCRKSRTLHYVLNDNGKGFDAANSQNAGYGLQNMDQRAKDSGGQFSIVSSPEDGTTITFEAKLDC